MNYFLKCLSSLNYIRKRKPSYSFEIQYYKSQQLFLSSCGWAKGVSNRGRTDRGNAYFLSSSFPLIPVCLSSLCLTAQGFPSLSHLPWAVSWLGTETPVFYTLWWRERPQLISELVTSQVIQCDVFLLPAPNIQ